MKSILVHLDASPRAAMRLTVAQQLARRHGAEVHVLYGVVPPAFATPWPASEGMSSVSASLRQLEQEQQQRARATFETALAHGPLVWHEGGPDGYWPWIQHALHTDLVVLGQTDPNDPNQTATGVLPTDLVPATIIDSGKPTLVIPFAGHFQGEETSNVLVAWKPTREAARALTASLPWLLQARHIQIAVQPEEPDPAIHDTSTLAHWMKLHGVTAQIETRGLGPGNVGERLLSLSVDVGADLLVMGCYGHSRAREWLLGGTSRTIMREMTLPVLLAH